MENINANADKVVGVNRWTIDCYASAAIENEMETMPGRYSEAKYFDAVRHAIEMAGFYAEQWQVDPKSLRAALIVR